MIEQELDEVGNSVECDLLLASLTGHFLSVMWWYGVIKVLI